MLFKKIYEQPLTRQEAEGIATQVGGTVNTIDGVIYISMGNGNAYSRNPETKKLTMGNINSIPK